MAPISELGQARDPQRAPVVAHDSAVVVDEAAAVAGEQAASARRVDVAPWIDPVTSGHSPENLREELQRIQFAELGARIQRVRWDPLRERYDDRAMGT